MSEAFILRRAGGRALSESFAAIAVNYPAGSICTCTNGSKLLKAKDTSGSYLFMIPEAGAWTVSATEGTEIASKTIQITKKYQSEQVNLDFIFYLLNGGDEKISITGGWQTRAMAASGTSSISSRAPTITKTDESINVKWAANSSGVFEVLNDIDLSAFGLLHVEVDASFQASISPRITVFKRDERYWYSNATAIATLKSGETQLDISSIEGFYDIAIGVATASSGALNVRRIWLS